MTKKTTRRRFMQFGAMGFGAVVTNFGFGPLIPKAKATASQRSRYLINLQSFGGQDSSWHHSPMLEKDTAGLDAAQKNAAFYGKGFDKPRFPDSLAIPMGTGHLGIGMSNFTTAELNRMAVWRGLVVEGSHDVGNHLIQDGHLSGYAASFSTIVADALAHGPDYMRSLHYVQISNMPSDFRSQVGFYHGPGIPLNIVDSATWTKLSATDPNDPATGTMKPVMAAGVAKLATETSGLALDASKKLFSEDFADSYVAAESIMGQNYATSPAFIATLARYKKAVIDDLTNVIFNAPCAAAVKEQLKFHPNFVGSGGFIANTATNVETALKGALNVADLNNAVFPFALADFLVTNDLSAVVDVPMLSGDFHDTNDREFLQVSTNLACYRSLLKKLATTQLPDNSGSFLDATLVVYSTEFDRQVARSSLTSSLATRPGTDHGSTSSVMFAGYGTNGGKIVGGRAGGPNGEFGNLEAGFLQPVPINISTGVPTAGGELPSQRSILPTVLTMFGIPVPSQQKTEMVAVPAMIKPGFQS